MKSPRMSRFLEDDGIFEISAPVELVSAEHFLGTDLIRNRFSFYGETIELPANFDWDHNPGSPHWGHDLNRFGFLILHSSENDLQAREMERLILDWIEKNGRDRYKYSVYAWQNLLNVGIRIENWWRFLGQRSRERGCSLTPADWRVVKRSVFGQLRILLRLIDKHGYGTNWAFLGLRAALSILYAAPGMPHQRRLVRLAWRGVTKAVDAQILPDGAQQELSPHYHWTALELLISCRDMAQDAGFDDGLSLDPVIRNMASFLEALMLPDGGIVALGDSDFDYGPRIRVFLDRMPAKLRPAAIANISVFPYAGIASLREPVAGHVFVFDAGPFGTAHQHEDALSFWLTAHGEHFLIDPGRYLYDTRPESIYTYLKSTAAHSTISVGCGQSAGAKPQTWRREAPSWPTVEAKGEIIRLTGLYEGGYGQDPNGIVHQRVVDADMSNARWTIHDCLTGIGTATVTSRFQFSPGEWRIDEGILIVRRGSAELHLEFDKSWDAQVVEGAISPNAGWYSSGLNKLAPAPCLILVSEKALSFETTVRISVKRLSS